MVEVGPGRGFLTRALAQRAGSVVAVELDGALAVSLEEKALPHVRVVCADAREIPIESLVDETMAYKLVANLPYYAASPIVRRFLESRHKPEVMVVMVQREVAQTMTAKQGKMGLLSVATQVYGRPKVVCHVPPRAFRPAPKVWSSVVRIDVYDAPAVPFDSAQGFFEVVRAGFSAPRKQIRNSLANGPGNSVDAGRSRSSSRRGSTPRAAPRRSRSKSGGSSTRPGAPTAARRETRDSSVREGELHAGGSRPARGRLSRDRQHHANGEPPRHGDGGARRGDHALPRPAGRRRPRTTWRTGPQSCWQSGPGPGRGR